MSDGVSPFNVESGKKKLLMAQTLYHQSGVVGLNESVEQVQGLASSAEQCLAVADLAESENERKAIHGAL